MTKSEELVLDVEQIKRLLPHRAPFLFVERLTEIRPGESATVIKRSPTTSRISWDISRISR